MDAGMTKKTDNQAERQSFYNTIGGKAMTPLWEVLAGLVTPEPVSPVQPHIWKWDDVFPHVMEAGSLISAEEAERRVLILENPGLAGKSSVTHSLYAGLQLILPGEIARSHRHTASALRFVLYGDGAYTAVDGERTIMRPGDFVITPPWTWHDHGNESDEPMVWMDGLDVPLVNYFDTSFLEHYPEDEQPVARPIGDALARYGEGVVPFGYETQRKCSPIFNYPYDRTRDALDKMSRSQDWDPVHGLKVQYVNPVSGDYAMPTISTFMQLLPKGFKTIAYRSTDSTVYSPVEGTGRTYIGDKTFEWGPRDVFVVPSWVPHYHEADGDDAVLFSFSDRAAQQKLGFWREQRGNERPSNIVG